MDTANLILAIGGAIVAAMFSSVLRRLKFDRVSILLSVAAIAVFVLHTFGMQWNLVITDPFAHLNYIQYILTEHALPEPYLEPAYRHPPAYYLFAAAAYWLGNIGGEQAAIAAVRLLSLGIYCVFLGYGMLLLRRFVPYGMAYYTALSLLLFWPLGVLIATTIGCEVVVSVCSAAILYHVLRWQERYEHEQLATALGFAGLAVLVKNSAVLWPALICGLAVLGLLLRRYTLHSLFRRDVLLALLIIFSAVATTYARAKMSHYLIPEMFEPLRFRDIFRFDLLEFLTYSIHQPISTVGNQYFWNFFLRSLLLGQWLWRSEWLALLLAVMLLAMLLYQLINLPGYLWKHRDRRDMYAINAMFLCAWILSCAAMFVMLRNSHYANARYVLILIPMLALAQGQLIGWHAAQGRRLLAGLGIGISALFVWISIMLLAAQHTSLLRFDIL